MGMISVRVDGELKERMEQHPEINWSVVTRQAINEKIAAIERLERMEEVAARSKATPEDANEIADLVNEGMAQRLREKGDSQATE
jgi:hypothetical protein